MQLSTKTFHISIPGLLAHALDKRVKEKYCSSRSQYMQDLIRADLVCAEKEQLERMLLEGLASGEPEYMDAIKREEFKNEVLAQVKNNK